MSRPSHERTPVARQDETQRQQTSLDVLLRCFAASVGGDTGMILGYDGGGRAQLLAACGAAAERLTAPWTSSSFLGRALSSEGVSLEAGPAPDGNGRSAVWSAVAAPIQGFGGPLGGIYAGFDPPSAVGSDRLRWITNAHARLAAMCMEERNGVSAALRGAGVDHLTGCLSYQRTLEMLGAEVERSHRHGHRLACAFLDLDGFKAVNDGHGHLEGNRVLAIVGEALREAARPYDGIGRVGGDEFVIILPETGAAAARRAVERLRWRVTFAVEEATGMVLECSAGIAGLESGGSGFSLLEAADGALQLAKAQGGARTHGGLPSERRFEGLLERTRAVIRGSGRPATLTAHDAGPRRARGGDVRAGELALDGVAQLDHAAVERGRPRQPQRPAWQRAVKRGLPPPSTTGTTVTSTSSRRPASANCEATLPPPTTHRLRSPADADHLLVDVGEPGVGHAHVDALPLGHPHLA